jgi:GLPGLI family protein
MKNITYLLFFFTAISFSQNSFQGIATYHSKTDMKSIGLDIPDMDDETKAKLIAKMSAAFEKTYLLKFNTFESTFEEEQKLTMQSSDIIQSVYNGISYKNTKEQIQISEIESFNKNFLISEPLKKMEWQLLNETKKIGEYTCLKATVLIPVSEEKLADYETAKKAQNNNQTTFLTVIEPKAETIVVWYSPEIPVANGPSSYWGLPGLILEANNGVTSILCSKIILNPKDKVAIKRPSKGKQISREDFEKMEEEKMESLKDENGVIHINSSGN